MPEANPWVCCVCGETDSYSNPLTHSLTSPRREVTIWWHIGCDSSGEVDRFIVEEFSPLRAEYHTDAAFGRLAFESGDQEADN